MTPLDTRGLFRPLHDELLSLLRSLAPEDWASRATPGWTVRDVAAHLLDGDLRRLSFQRDGQPLPQPDRPVEGFGGLVGFLNRLNADWVEAARRLSPRVLTDLLALSGPQFAQLVESQALDGKAFFAVAWAGDHADAAWLDIARDFTERWHHQQQIREAVGAPLLTSTRWLRPVLQVSMLALPRAYGAVPADDGASVAITIDGASGGTWNLLRNANGWTLSEGAGPAAASVRLDEETAWRLFLKMLPPEQASSRVRFEGNPRLAEAFLEARAVMG